MKDCWRGGGFGGRKKKKLDSLDLKRTAVAAIRRQNVAINPIITKLASAKAAKAFFFF